MRATIAIVATFIVACAKEPITREVQLNAICRMCAIEFKDGAGVVHRDTIIGDILWGGETPPDTTIGTGRWNVVIRAGDPIWMRACHLRPSAMDGGIHLRVRVFGSTTAPTAHSRDECAEIDRPLAQ